MLIPIEYLLKNQTWFLCKHSKLYYYDLCGFKFRAICFNPIKFYPPPLLKVDENDFLIDEQYAQKDTHSFLLVLKMMQLNDYEGFGHPIADITLQDEDGYSFGSFNYWSIAEKEIRYYGDDGRGYKDEIRIDGYFDGLHDFDSEKINSGYKYNIGLAFNLPPDDNIKYFLNCNFDSIVEISGVPTFN